MPTKTKRVTMAVPQYANEYGGRLLPGSSVDLPEDVADKWLEMGIARSHKKGDRSAKEMRRAELLAELAEMDAEGGSQYSRAITVETVERGPRRRSAAEEQAIAEDSHLNAAEPNDDDEQPAEPEQASGRKR